MGFKNIIIQYLLFLLTIQSIGAQEIHDDDEVSETAENYLKMARSAYGEGDYEQHKKYSDSLYHTAKQHGLTKMQILGLVNRGVFFNTRGAYQEAIEQYLEALELCKSTDKDLRTKLIVLVNLGNSYQNISNYEKAISTMEEVLTTYDNLNNDSGYRIQAAATFAITMSYLEMDDFKKAMLYAKKTKDIAEVHADEDLLSSSLGALSDINIETENYEKALAYIDQRLKLPQLKKPTKHRANALLAKGQSLHLLGRSTESVPYLMASKSIAEEKSLNTILVRCYHYLALAHEENGDLTKSLEAQKSYTDLKTKQLDITDQAASLEIRRELNEKENLLVQMNSKARNYLLLAIGIALVSGILVYVYRKNQKRLLGDHERLQLKYANLVSISESPVAMNTSKSDTDRQKRISYKNSSLNQEDYDKYKDFILDYMKEHKPFLDQNLSQKELAQLLDMSPAHLSEVLHFAFDQNFYTFINGYRVMEAQRLLRSDKGKHVKILSIALDSGFQSKTSFNRVFKAYVGQTPTEFKNSSSQ